MCRGQVLRAIGCEWQFESSGCERLAPMPDLSHMEMGRHIAYYSMRARRKTCHVTRRDFRKVNDVNEVNFL